eukprot:scaffold200219_cov19-Prasinocladus_malaysianus.AAC.1
MYSSRIPSSFFAASLAGGAVIRLRDGYVGRRHGQPRARCDGHQQPPRCSRRPEKQVMSRQKMRMLHALGASR